MAPRSELGHWWIPGNETIKVPGLLSSDAEHDSPASLELIHPFPPQPVETEGYASILLGVAEGTQYSLLGCSRGGPAYAVTSPNEHWVISHVGIGHHMASAEDRFRGCFLTMDGLGGWVTAEELQSTRHREGQDESRNETSEAGVRIADFVLGGFLVRLEARTDRKGTVGVLDDHDCTLWIATEEPKSFDQFKEEVILPLQSLVSIATGSRGSIRMANFFGDAEKSLMFFGGVWTGQHAFVSRWKLKPLFSAQDLVAVNSPSLDRWGELYAEHRYALTTFQGIPLMTEAPQKAVAFMTLVSCLEALLDREADKRFSKDVLNRMREAVNDIVPEPVREEVLHAMGSLRSSTSRTRLEKYIFVKPKVLGKVAETPEYAVWTIHKIIATRNCAAHSTPELCAEAAAGSELHALQEFVRMLINTRVLELLGFSDDQIAQQFVDTFEYGSVAYLDTAWRSRPDPAT